MDSLQKRVIPYMGSIGSMVRGISWPSFRPAVVGVYEIFASVHPNYYAFTFLFVLIGLFVYMKIRFPFWNAQPILHTYLGGWGRGSTPQILQKYPYRTKWVDSARVQTLDVSRISKEEMRQIAVFLQTHYFPSDRLLSTLTDRTLDVVFRGHNAPSFVSAYTEIDGTLSGVVSSRLARVCFYSTPTPFSLESYYMDWLCIHREITGRPLTETLFQTHEYNQRIQYPAIATSIFRKEGELCQGVVPLLEYTKYTFYMRNLRVSALPAHYQIVRVEKENRELLQNIYHLFTDDLVAFADFAKSPDPVSSTAKKSSSRGRIFDGSIFPDLSNMAELLVSREMGFFCLRNRGHVYGAYFFRNAHVHYDDIEGDTLELVASIHNSDSPELFFRGFVNSLKQWLRDQPTYKMLVIHAVGHNMLIVDSWRKWHHSILETPSAVYLYNFAWPGGKTVDASKWLVLI